MFEKFNVPAMFLAKDAVLACYACGRTSGLVVDVGASGTCISPVQDGWVDSKGLNRSHIGGRYMDAHALSLLQSWRPTNPPLPNYALERNVHETSTGRRAVTSKPKALPNISRSYQAYMALDMAKEMKESISRATESPLADIEGKLVNIPVNHYELPDGTIIDIGLERFACAELLFDSSSVDLEPAELVALNLHPTRPSALHNSNNTQSIAQLAADSVFRCDVELQAACVSNLVVTGGCAAIDNLPERIRSDLENVIKPGK